MNRSAGRVGLALLCVLAGALSFGLGLLALPQMGLTSAAGKKGTPPAVAKPCRT
jgi:hypothetical protein